MTETSYSDTRTRLLETAADMIAAAPGEEVSLRAVCESVGVKMPTLYHFFGSKKGLIDAVIERGFDMYLGEKESMEHTGDPIQDIRAGWDAHVAFGLANPGFYTLMYGTVQPGYSPEAQARPTAILRSLTTRAAEQNRLVVPAEQAAAHILASNVGVTLRQIIKAEADPELSRAMRDGVIAAITGAGAVQASPVPTVIELAAAHREVLGATQTQLLIEWLNTLHTEVERAH